MVQEEPEVKPTAEFTLTEASKLLHVDRSTIHRWIKKNKMKCRYRQINDSPVVTGLEIIRVWNKKY